MKKCFLLILLTVTSLSFAQRTDIDEEFVDVSFIAIPANPVLDQDFRTYSVSVHSTYLSQDAYPNSLLRDKVKLYGFEKVNENGTIDVKIDIGNVFINPVEIKKRKVEEKDKEGNITSTKYYYRPLISYTTDGSVHIKNHTEEAISFKLGGAVVHKTKEYNTYKEASSYYNNNRGTLRSNFTRDFVKSIPGIVNDKINYNYGYEPINRTTKLWILDSKKNPDYQAYQDTYKLVKEVFSGMRHDEPIDEIKIKVQPAIDYFLSILPKYPEDKRKHRKMRFASYYNLIKIYYHLDMMDEVIKYADLLIENDYDKYEGKNYKKYANSILEKFEANQITTRHFKVETIDNTFTDNSQSVVVQEVESVKTEAKKVYLDAEVITKNGETIEGKVQTIVDGNTPEEQIKVPTFNKYVKLYLLNDDDDDVTIKKYYAKDVESAVIGNVAFESVYFTTVGKQQVKGEVLDLGSTLKGPASRFCRVLYKSDKIGVYQFDKEFILKKPGDKKGASTSSMGYIIAFNKKLSKFASDCKIVSGQAKEGEFENSADSLAQFGREYTEECK